MEFISGNVFIRSNAGLENGHVIQGHKHNFDHTTIIFSGSVHVRATLPNGNVISRIFGDHPDAQGRHFLVKADVEHEITALADHTEYWCVYSHRTPQGDITQFHTGWGDAYV